MVYRMKDSEISPHNAETPGQLNIAGVLPTRKNLVIRGHGDTQSCPCCGAASEDLEHLFICPNVEIQKNI